MAENEDYRDFRSEPDVEGHRFAPDDEGRSAADEGEDVEGHGRLAPDDEGRLETDEEESDVEGHMRGYHGA